MRCPKCKQNKTMVIPKSWITYDPGDDKVRVTVGAPLYQVGYEGDEGYISPRCSKCIDKARGASDVKSTGNH